MFQDDFYNLDKIEYCQKDTWEVTGMFNLEQGELKNCYIDTLMKSVDVILSGELECNYNEATDHFFAAGEENFIENSDSIKFTYNSNEFKFTIETSDTEAWGTGTRYDAAASYLVRGVYDCLVKFAHYPICVTQNYCTDLCVYNLTLPSEVENYPYNDCSSMNFGSSSLLNSKPFTIVLVAGVTAIVAVMITSVIYACWKYQPNKISLGIAGYVPIS
jgi:hypothetical protein